MESQPIYYQLVLSVFDGIKRIWNSRYRTGIALDILGILLVIVLGATVNPKLISPLPQNSFFSLGHQTVMLPNGQIAPIPNLVNLFTKDMKYKEYIKRKGSQIMADEIGSDTRLAKEVSLFNFLKNNNASSSDMILALSNFASTSARALAMEYLWQARQSGKFVEFNLYPFSSQKIQWAREHNIDPRMLAIATDVYPIVVRLLSSSPELFFEAAKEKTTDSNIYKYVPSPAVLAKLQMTETGWQFDQVTQELEHAGLSWNFPINKEDRAFVNIGSVSAWDAINLSPDWFPSGHTDLLWIAKDLEQSTELPFVKNVKNIPGSARGWGDGSGGAIGPQFMPINARLFMSWYKKANEKFGNKLPNINPFDPWGGAILSYLYLSSEFYHRQASVSEITDIVRPGYKLLAKEDAHLAYDIYSDPRMKALLKWNPLYWEAKEAIEAGDDYSSIWNATDTLTYNKAGYEKY